MVPGRVFVCHSHKNRVWRDRLKTCLTGLDIEEQYGIPPAAMSFDPPLPAWQCSDERPMRVSADSLRPGEDRAARCPFPRYDSSASAGHRGEQARLERRSPVITRTALRSRIRSQTSGGAEGFVECSESVPPLAR